MTIYTTQTIQNHKKSSPVATQHYKGFSTVSSKSKNFALFDFELIKQDLLNSFYVRQGERLMQPAIGCIIWELLFEPLTPEVQNLILQNVNQIFNSDPRIQASGILITPYDNGLQIECQLKYFLYNIQETLQMQFDQTNGFMLAK